MTEIRIKTSPSTQRTRGCSPCVFQSPQSWRELPAPSSAQPPAGAMKMKVPDFWVKSLKLLSVGVIVNGRQKMKRKEHFLGWVMKRILWWFCPSSIPNTPVVPVCSQFAPSSTERAQPDQSPLTLQDAQGCGIYTHVDLTPLTCCSSKFYFTPLFYLWRQE